MGKQYQGKPLWVESLLTIAGAGISAFGFYMFITAKQLAPGGVSGLSYVVSYILNTPVGLTVLALNIPLLILGYFSLGKRFIFKTVLAVVSFTLLYDYVYQVFPQYTGETILAALFGGVFNGTGIALAFYAESSTGGFDISSKVIQKRFPHISIGRIVFFSDTAVILSSAVVFGSIENAMYAAVAMFVSSRIVDSILYGLDVGKMILIISHKSEEVGRYLLGEMDRGITKLDCRGLYSNEEKGMLICAVRNNEYHRLKRLTHEIDPNAFLIATTATEVLGEGFKAMDKM